jgi:membrane-bound lytic murein transglycosylase B
MHRRVFLAGFAASLAAGAAAPARADSFEAFVASLKRDAERAGVRDSTFDQAVAGLSPDSTVPTRAASQPEFETPIWDYLRRAAGPARLSHGRAALARWAAPLSVVSKKCGVPGEIIAAAWGMEADFTQPAQDRDVLRAIATLAWTRPADPGLRVEFVAALTMLDRGLVARSHLRGSWAGAMGMPQFMPSAYLRYAVSFRGSGAADIWTSVPDALASIGNFFARSGWAAGLPWGAEVELPPGFAWASLNGRFADWKRLGLRRSDGRPLPERGEATLFAPAGASGPVLLLTENFQTIKKYDNSDSYALALGLLADALAGRRGLVRAWPADLTQMSRDDRVRLQQGLAARALYEGPTDGKVGPATREAVHKFQVAARLNPADGLATPAVLAALDRSR